MKKLNKLILLLYGVTIVTSCSPIPSTKKSRSEDRMRGGTTLSTSKEERMDSLLKRLNIEGSPGASIAVIEDGKILFSKSYGDANLEYNIPISKNTIFHVASLSKQFTAFSIALLADQGKLSIDDDIRKYVPEMPDLGVIITIKNLIYHTSGLRDQFELLQLAGWRSDDVITEEQILKLIYNQGELNFKPGEEFQYSNTNYTLLAKIVEVATGEKFSNWTQKHLFTPLGMKHTFFYDNHEKIVKNRAYSYTRDNQKYRKKVLNYSTVGATSLFTTAEDLGLWVDNFKTKKIGSQEVMDQMLSKEFLNNGAKIGYSFGQGVSTYKGLPLIYHPGSDAGYRAYIGRFPDQGLTVVVLSNFDTFDPEKTSLQIADIYLEEYFSTRPNLQDYEGNYEIEKQLILKFGIDENSLKAQVIGKNDLHYAIHIKGDTFEVPTLEASLTFDRNRSGHIDQLTVKKDNKIFVAPKLFDTVDTQCGQDQLIIPTDSFRDYQGSYDIKKPIVLTITFRDNKLSARITGKKDNHLLVPKAQSEFEVPSLNAEITFVREKNGVVQHLSFYKEGKTMIAPKIEPKGLDKIDLKEIAGRYYSKELGTSYTFELNNGSIIAKHQRHDDIPLILLEPDFLKGNKILKNVKVIRSPEHKVVGIEVTSDLVRNLWFEKVELLNF